jgi:hypothetical protein
MSGRLAPQVLAWVGALGPPAAWALQHVAGFLVALADCPDHTAGPGWDVPVDTATIVIGATAATLTLLCGGAAFLAWRATRESDDSDAPPGGRVHFLAVIGLTITPLFLAMIVMSSSGAIAFQECVQS